MSNTTHTRNLKIVATAFVVVILLGLLLFAIGKKQISEMHVYSQQYVDSLTELGNAKDIQIGYALADAQKQSERAVKAELASKQRDTIYLTRIVQIKAAAPDTCQPYLTAMQNECDTLILMHVISEMTKDTLLAKKDTIIAQYASKDSISTQLIIAKDNHINNLRADNKAKDKEIADLKKNNRWQRWRDGLLGFVFGFGAGSAVPRD